MYTDMDGKYSNINLNVKGLFKLTPAELEELMEMLTAE